MMDWQQNAVKFIFPYVHSIAIILIGLKVDNMKEISINHGIDIVKILENAERRNIPDVKPKIEAFIQNPCVETLTSIRKILQTKELIWYAIRSGNCDPILSFANKGVLTSEMCVAACSANGINLKYVPARLISEEICNVAVKNRGESLCFVPKRFLTYDLCYEAVNNDNTEDAKAAQCIPKKFLLGKAGVALYKAAVNHNPVAVKQLPPLRKIIVTEENIPQLGTYGLLPVQSNTELVDHKVMSLAENSDLPVYYISDIHLEHQLSLVEPVTECEIEERIRQKILELVQDIPGKSSIMLFAGDISYSPWLHKIFRQELEKVRKEKSADWLIVYVLGNHELWDDDPFGLSSPRDFSRVIESYDGNLLQMFSRTHILENSILVRPFKNNVIGNYSVDISLTAELIPERCILSMDLKSLKERCKDSIIILGGIGFSGHNQHFNAISGIYRNKISRKEEIARTEMFNRVYEKLLKIAADEKVIVVTHMPVSDWLNGDPNPNWIYVCGHTHQNSMLRKTDGTTILADNQVGYNKQTLHFNKFSICKWLDPFLKYNDGIHVITNEQYIQFNQYRGIPSKGCRRDGTLYMIKRDNFYMFFLNGNNLYILSGGKIKKSEYSLAYYYEHITEYVIRTKRAFMPYRAAITRLSEEVKRFGGTGNIHGSIVDIDFYTHIFFDPFTGNMTPYFALNRSNHLTYPSVFDLLQEAQRNYNRLYYNYDISLYAPNSGNYSEMLKKYQSLTANSQLSILSASQPDNALIEADHKMACTIMYRISTIVKTIQYLFENNVVRLWNDAVFHRCSERSAILPCSLPSESNESKQ